MEHIGRRGILWERRGTFIKENIPILTVKDQRIN